jgi:long-subunit fatty acid transport protein
LLVKAHERVSLGARWMIGQRVEIDNGEIESTAISVPGVRVPVTTAAGTVFVPVDTALQAQFASGGRLATGQQATTSVPLPDQVVLGAAIQATTNLKLLVDYQFTRWSMFDKLEIVGPANGLGTTGVVEDYRNTNGLRVGVEADVSPRAVVRAGLDVHGAAAPPQTVTPNLPEGPRQEYTLGLGLNVSPRTRIDFGYMYLRQEDRAGRTTTGGYEYPQQIPVTVNNGTYAFNANIFNVTLALRF